MSYVNDHEVFGSEKMMIGNVPANIGLSPRFHSLPYERRSGTSAHRHLLDRNIQRMRSAGHFKSEFFFDIFNEHVGCHRLEAPACEPWLR